MKVDKVIAWKFTCPACGSNCTTTIPVVNLPVNQPMPPCPIDADSIERAINQVLPASSPLGGVKVTAIGTIDVRNEINAEVLKLSINMLVQ